MAMKDGIDSVHFADLSSWQQAPVCYCEALYQLD